MKESPSLRAEIATAVNLVRSLNRTPEARIAFALGADDAHLARYRDDFHVLEEDLAAMAVDGENMDTVVWAYRFLLPVAVSRGLLIAAESTIARFNDAIKDGRVLVFGAGEAEIGRDLDHILNLLHKSNAAPGDGVTL